MPLPLPMASTMSTGEPKTIHVVTAEGVAVDAATLDSGVSGLALVGAPASEGWRLIHIASGRIVSRSAQHPDPDVLRKLAHRLAAFADWTERDVRVPGPVLRREIEAAAVQLGLSSEPAAPPSHRVAGPKDAGAESAVSSPSAESAEPMTAEASAWAPPSEFPSVPTAPVTTTGSANGKVRAASNGAVSTDEAAELRHRLTITERERALLRRILRRVHTSVAPGTFADAIRDLDAEERALLGSLITDGASDATGVVRALPRTDGDEPTTSVSPSTIAAATNAAASANADTSEPDAASESTSESASPAAAG